MTKPRLVDDLIPLILESRVDWWTPREYTRLSLISPAWRYYVQKRLYAFTILRTFKSCELLGRTLRDNPSLAELVKGVELRPKYDPEEGMTGEHFQAIQLLLGLEGLQQLTLGGNVLSVKAERLLNAVAFPESIVQLAVEGDATSSRQGSLELAEDFWQRFSSVRTLSFVNMSVTLDIAPEPVIPPPIKHAILMNCDISLCHLLAGSSLDLLDIQADCSCEHYHDLQQILHNTDICEVKALRYTVTKECRESDGTFLHSPAGITTAPTLRSLHLDGHFIDQDILNALRLYPSLEELIVGGRSIRITSQEWADFIGSGLLSSLQRLRLPGGTSWPPYAKWSAEELEVIRLCCSSRQVCLLT
ncbi:hypothetical protein BKA70DRAFT_1367692 [Coprinopsis sp. MPI-PUGE-AT-0042]|nr:hypothetical protein BKA70DRAFT_1367692 [Coprinopsis sp. MPI-PUGE-AT-0042]